MRVDANFLTDNPRLYEAQFPDPEHLAARFVLDVLARHGLERGALLDVGCGTGRDAAHWARHGFHVTGIDNSPRMVEHAGAHCPDATFRQADMRAFRLDRTFDAITCLDSAFLYCHTDDELDSFLQRCRDHLRPGGMLVAEMRNGAFFLGNTELLDGIRERTVEWEGVPYRSRTRLWIDHAEQLLRRERVWDWPGCERELTQRSAWRLLFPQELRRVLRQAGFEVLDLFDHPGPRTEPAWRSGAHLGTSLAGDRLHLVAHRPT
ncbi:class I SAM-dependent methyltransferase [Saccharopolyspora sp. NPDC047091]|uniref:class I SAM-dependent methyltransferase n=1 Tax=Saccharopolyspora sp. NPDC047091 TaxID=3155924 RepID=UPI00340C8005